MVTFFVNYCLANVEVTSGALGQEGESPGVTVFHFLMRRYETT